MYKRQGFTLVELLVYTVVSSFLVVTVMHVVSIIQRHVAAQQRVSIVQAGVYACLDSFAYSCAQAPCSMQHWIIHEPHSIGWITHEGKLIFEFKHDALMRIFSARDQFGLYKQSCSSLLIPHVKGSFHVCSNDGCVVSVNLELQHVASSARSFKRKFYVRSGHIT
jgi:type II secretory pathway pseudopilin PulG